jgi:hypothetical protein
VAAALIVGALVAGAFAISLVALGASATIVGHHISYAVDHPHALAVPGSIGYGLATIAPPFLSGRPRVALLGVGIALSYVGTALFAERAVVSLWCYFAALLSVLVWWILDRQAADGSAAASLTSGRARSAS